MATTYHPADYIAPAGTFVLEHVHIEAGEVIRKQVFRSLSRLFEAHEAERADPEYRFVAYRVIGSGPDGYTEPVRL